MWDGARRGQALPLCGCLRAARIAVELEYDAEQMQPVRNGPQGDRRNALQRWYRRKRARDPSLRSG